nr:ribonuclease H-like domain-containing protein [Tanacetum cinerariifolium]
MAQLLAAPPQPIIQAHYAGVPTQNQMVQQLLYEYALVPYYGAPTVFPYAFHTMTSQDPVWNMDTGASSHLVDTTGDDVLRRLESRNLISCRKSKLSTVCHACQLGKHAKLPFYTSESSVDSVFEIIHSDIWTSPIPSESELNIMLYS